MRWIQRVVSTMLLLCSLSACASYQLSPAAMPGVQARYNHGRVLLMASGKRSVVALMPLGHLFGGEIVLDLAAYNGSGYPVNLGYANVRVTDDTGTQVSMIDADTLTRQAKTKALLRKVAIGVAAGLDAATIVQRSTSHASGRQESTFHGTGSYSGSGLGSHGAESFDGYGSSTYNASYYDAGLANQLTQQNADFISSNMTSINQRLRSDLEQIDSLTLQTSTIDSGKSWHGLVWFRRPESADYRIHKLSVEVDYAGDVYHFSFYLGAPGAEMPNEMLPAFSSTTLASSLPGLFGPSADVGMAPAQPDSVSYTTSRF